MGKRNYRLKRRAEKMEETSRQIAEATFELHSSIGPSNTSIKAIAERAGVERLTVYRHFPDELSLFRACVLHGLEAYPMPDPEPWKGVTDPAERLRQGLGELYGYYRETEEIWSNILPDLPRMPALQKANAPTFQRFAAIQEALVEGWGVRGKRLRLLRATVGLFIQFPTWQSLAVQGGLFDEEAVGVAAGAVRRVID